MRTMRFFDFEVTPNWWLCVLGDLPYDFENVTRDIKDNFYIVTSDDVIARERLMSLLKEENTVIIGYNIKNYDLPIANGIYQGFSPQQIKIINDIIINPTAAYESKEAMRLAPFAKKKLSGTCYQDLMDDGAGSLKEKEATLGLNVLESSVDFNKENLTDEDKEDMIYYCKQDVYASMYFYMKVVHPYTQTKLHMGKKFNIPEVTCYTSTNARLVSIALGAKRRTYSDENRIDIELPDKIKSYCYENLPINVLERVRCTKDNFKVTLFENEVSFGNGGIHSVYKGNFNTPPCLYLETDDEYCLVNVDANSYYPSEMIQFKLLSRSAESYEKFINVFDERIALKFKENKTPEEEGAQKADKLVLNTTFGASGNKWLDLYDPYMGNSVCKVGQIFLGSLANKIYKTVPSAKIIQTNTDGILVYLAKKDLPILTSLQDEWSKISGINMERDDVIKIWQRDVNNYLMILIDKGKLKVKRKGGWLNDDYYRPGYVTTASANAFVCAKAVIKYLTNGEDIVTNIVNNTNLADFTITCTKGPTYRGVVQRLTNGEELPLYKANRVVATKNDNLGKIYKYKVVKGVKSYAQMPGIPEHCLLVNKNLQDYDFNEIKKELDYMYYINRCADMLDMTWYQIKGTNIFENKNFNYFDN